MLSRVLVALWILVLSTLGSASPLYYRSPLSSLPTPTTSSPERSDTATPGGSLPKSTADPEVSPLRKDESTLSLDWMWAGNEAFRDQKDEILEEVESAPKVLFLGCSDSRLSPEVVFQTDAGTTRSHFNLGNQFSSQDLSSSSVIDYAINELKVKHIVIMGHYGCKSVEKAIGQISESKTSSVQRWLQPVVNLYTSSKRFEVRRLRTLRKGSDIKSTLKAKSSGLRALVEENVKASVQNLQDEIKPLLGDAAYKEVELYGHGIVVDEETGEVKDMNVSFGPPGKELVEIPFDKVPKARMHIPIGKFEAKKKKVAPVSTGEAQAAFSVTGSF